MTIQVRISHVGTEGDIEVEGGDGVLAAVLRPGESTTQPVWGEHRLALSLTGDRTSDLTIHHLGEHGRLRLVMMSAAGMATGAAPIPVHHEGATIGPGDVTTYALWPKWTFLVSEVGAEKKLEAVP